MNSKTLTRRKFLLGLLPFAALIASQMACGDDYKTRRNKKLKRRGDDWLEDGNGKGWDDKKGDD